MPEFKLRIVTICVINFGAMKMKFETQKGSSKVQGGTFGPTPAPAANPSSSKMKTCFITDKGVMEDRG
jgi:hypothetical protein